MVIIIAKAIKNIGKKRTIDNVENNAINMKRFGKKQPINALQLKELYFDLAKSHEKAALILSEKQLYSEAVFMLIQAIEKKVTGSICSKINMGNPYFSQKIRDIGHRVDESVDFLIEILSGNDLIFQQQLIEQLKTGVFEGLKFNILYNECRYPYPMRKKESTYSIRLMSQDDFLRLSRMNCNLDLFINDLDRI